MKELPNILTALYDAQAAGRPKDLYVLPELEALEELKRKTGAK